MAELLFRESRWVGETGWWEPHKIQQRDVQSRPEQPLALVQADDHWWDTVFIEIILWILTDNKLNVSHQYSFAWKETNHILPSVWKSTTSGSRDVMFAFRTCDTASRVLQYPSYTLKFWDSEFRRDLANPEWIQPRSWAGAFVLWREVGRAQLVQPAEETAKFHCCLQSPKGGGTEDWARLFSEWRVTGSKAVGMQK